MLWMRNKVGEDDNYCLSCISLHGTIEEKMGDGLAEMYTKNETLEKKIKAMRDAVEIIASIKAPTEMDKYNVYDFACNCANMIIKAREALQDTGGK